MQILFACTFGFLLNKLLPELQNQLLSERLIPISVVQEINALYDEIFEHARLSLIKAIKIGEKLTPTKELVGHGQWMRWVAENLHFGIDSAQDYMRLYEKRDEIMTKFGVNPNIGISKALVYLSTLKNGSKSDEPQRLHEPNFHSQAVRLRQNLVALFNHHLQRRPLKVWHTEEIYDLFCSLKPMTEICSQLETELNTRDDVPASYRQATAG